ncbi:MAG: protease modulator HflC [Gammaproteobacteria bacterium]|nr:protease modulator HflC [Gammaproteobacteria bacterium]
MSAKKLGLVVIAGLVAIGISLSAFTVKQWEMAIKLQLGEIKDAEYKPGLHWMIPLINNVKRFDGRIQTLDARPQRFLTVEKKDVIVDSFVKWRIANVGQYYRSTGGNTARTSSLLAERINTSLRDEFGKRTIVEVVSGERSEIMAKLTRDADEKANELGVQVIDVRIKRIDLPSEVSGSVYERMRAERERVARDLRAKGDEAAEKIQAEADRQRTVILANAFRDAEKLRGQGDAKAASIYAKAYETNSEFYAFYRSLAAYRSVFTSSGNMMVLKPDSEFFKYFNSKESEE